MNKTLTEKTNEWMQLERKTMEQRKKAAMFYDENLMDLIVEDFIERNKDEVFEDVDFMVVSVGTSYEPIVLNIKLFNPKRILFLYTRTSESVLQKIVTYCDLKADQYEKRRVSETDPLDIYKEIKEIYLEWDKPERLYIDFTGGTKAMSVASAMAGAMVDGQLIYVGTSDYLVDFRKPRPGSETLYYISNPLSVFGDLEIEKALTLFTQFNFSGVKEKLEYLKESIPDPEIRQQLNFVYLLAKAYEAWDSLDFGPAFENVGQLNSQLKRDRMHRDFLLMDYSGQLRKQEQILANVREIPELVKQKKNMEILGNKDVIVSLMFTMYQNAMTRERQEKLDMATLLLYRLLEMISQRRLYHYNLNVSNMEYAEMKCSPRRMEQYKDKTAQERLEILKSDVWAIKKELFGKAGSNYLPEQVSLLEGYIILYAFRDPIVYMGPEDHLALLKRIRAMVYLRNNSIFAHGLGPVRKADYLKFRNFVKEMFVRFCKIEKVDMEAMEESIQWINPMESRNYTSMEG